MNKNQEPNWRNDKGLICNIEYRKKFALWRVTCSDGSKVWLEYYYKRYDHWSNVNQSINDFEPESVHKEYVECITEAEYIVRKITEGF